MHSRTAPGCGAQVFETSAPRDLGQPLSQRDGIAERTQAHVGADEHVLHDVLTVGAVGNVARADRPHAAGVALDEGGEPAFLSGQNPRH